MGIGSLPREVKNMVLGRMVLFDHRPSRLLGSPYLSAVFHEVHMKRLTLCHSQLR